ncbi:MAG: hypothetical protein K6L60_15885, partial [Oceanobacter sp.]
EIQRQKLSQLEIAAVYRENQRCPKTHSGHHGYILIINIFIVVICVMVLIFNAQFLEWVILNYGVCKRYYY